MAGGFACPECGESISPRGLTPGREVICPACSTLVEVPYLPRATARPRQLDVLTGQSSRTRGRSGQGRISRIARRRLRWGLAFGAVGLVALATWWGVGSIGSKVQSDRERVLNELIAASDAAQAAGNPGGAFREIEAALIEARKLDLAGSARLIRLIERRDNAARAEVQARLAALGKLNPEPRAGEAQILADRAQRDPALAPLADSIAAALEAAMTNRAETDQTNARTSLAAGQGLEAFRLASRAYDRAAELTSRVAAKRIQDGAQTVIVAVIERYGTTLLGQPSEQNGPDNHFSLPIWTEALTRRGYLILPTGSPWTELFKTHAPYQASTRVVETHEGLYLQSRCRPTQIDGQFTLSHQGQLRWETRIYAQTRSPLPDLPAYIAGRLATADHRDPEIERRLLDDARTAFRVQVDQKFRGIPVPGASAASIFAPSPTGAGSPPRSS